MQVTHTKLIRGTRGLEPKDERIMGIGHSDLDKGAHAVRRGKSVCMDGTANTNIYTRYTQLG